MFTLKFYTNSKNEEMWNVVSTPNYKICNREGGAIVSVYSAIGGETGVDYQIGIDDCGYNTLFIENANGKTIDRVGPFKVSIHA